MTAPSTKLHIDQVDKAVREAIAAQPVLDIHTHLYPPSFGTPVANPAIPTDPAGLMLWGIDELVTYHYLVAEVFRVVPPTVLPYESFWKMSKREQADHIWKWLFVERTPISEACRGVLTSLQSLGLDPNEPTLDAYRKFFAARSPDGHIDRVMELANVSSITMTNDLFNDNERARWLQNPSVAADPRFRPVLRIDALAGDYGTAAARLIRCGCAVGEEPTAAAMEAVRSFLREWIRRMKPRYLAVSAPPEFRFRSFGAPNTSATDGLLLRQAVLPVCEEFGLPFALMIGSMRGVQPALRDAGDMLGRGDVESVANLCREFPANRFLVTMLSRENQHELCVAARKFANLMIFGCWWFLNNPSLIEEIERMRVELLGTSFIPQHSDARVLEQLLYKWSHSRHVLASVVAEKYRDLIATGRSVTPAQLARDMALLLETNATQFVGP